jgi:membrane dipeptidase
MTAPDDRFTEHAREILRESPLIDGHNDLAFALRQRVGGVGTSTVDLRGHVDGLDTDIPRLREGGVGGQFWSVWVPADLPEPDALRMGLEQLDIVHRLVERYPDAFTLATTADEVEAAFRAGRIASLIGLEGGSMIASSMAALRQFHARGVRYMTLTHWRTTRWADAATDPPQHDGLTPFGHEVVREMNRLGMLVDLSHTSVETMSDALDASHAPVIFSHSSARALCDVARNVPDEILGRMPANGGVVMVTFVAGFIGSEAAAILIPAIAEFGRRAAGIQDVAVREALAREIIDSLTVPSPPLELVADHVEHVARVAGHDHVGIGGDYDGNTFWPVDLEDVSCYPNLFAELLRRGWTEEDLGKLSNGNIRRVLRDAEAVAG